MSGIACSKLAGMQLDRLREICLSFPGATEQVQWGNDLVFKIGGKMFAVAPLEPGPVVLSFKTSPEMFAELTERPYIIPAPYLARAKWVALETRTALPQDEIASLLRTSYDLVLAKLPRKFRDSLVRQVPAKLKKGRRLAAKYKTAAG